MINIPILRIVISLGGMASPLAFAVEETMVPAPAILADSNITSNLLQTTLGLLAVLAIIAAVAWAVKRFGNFRTGVQGQLKIVGGVSLGTRERVVLLQVGEQQLVLGVAPGQIRTLHVLDQPLSPLDKESMSPPSSKLPDDSFADRLKTAIKSGSIT